jgi:hypothetical protein
MPSEELAVDIKSLLELNGREHACVDHEPRPASRRSPLDVAVVIISNQDLPAADEANQHGHRGCNGGIVYRRRRSPCGAVMEIGAHAEIKCKRLRHAYTTKYTHHYCRQKKSEEAEKKSEIFFPLMSPESTN